MTIFRNKKDGMLYRLYNVSPRGYTGEWLESEGLFTGERKKLNLSSWRKEDFEAVAFL